MRCLDWEKGNLLAVAVCQCGATRCASSESRTLVCLAVACRPCRHLTFFRLPEQPERCLSCSSGCVKIGSCSIDLPLEVMRGAETILDAESLCSRGAEALPQSSWDKSDLFTSVVYIHVHRGFRLPLPLDVMRGWRTDRQSVCAVIKGTIRSGVRPRTSLAAREILHFPMVPFSPSTATG